MAKGKTARVTRDRKCPVCGHADWCRVSADGRYVLCNRVQSARAEKGDGGAWLHWIGQVGIAASFPKEPTTPSPQIAPIERRHAVYSRLLQLCPLSPEHVANLDRRGLDEQARRHRQYGTLPMGYACRVNATKDIQDKIGAVDSVPGFYWTGHDWTISGWPGMLIPVREATKSLIQGLQVRLDGQADRRYVWLSSADREAGCGSGAPCHVAYLQNAHDDGQIWLTEGPLKADIASDRLHRIVVAMPGVASWRAAVATCKPFLSRADTLVVALDSDARTNAAVRLARQYLTVQALDDGWQVRWALWPPEFKGLDDALVAKTEIAVVNPFNPEGPDEGVECYELA